MNEAKDLDKNVIALGATGVIFVLFLLLYFFPRANKLDKVRASIESLQVVRQEASVLLPEVARTVPSTPLPQPDVRTWLATNSVATIDSKNLVGNDSYLQGQGAQVKLRRLSPEQAAQFISSLTRVRLIVERMQLQDSDADGLWDMEINLKVP